MSVSRFVFLARRADTGQDDVTWMLVSSNSRPLGRAVAWYGDLDTCLASVATLRTSVDRLRMVVSVINSGRNWQWRAELDGKPAAVASRTYVRQYECEYNLRRFLEALPVADIPSTVRTVHRGGA
jgi:hypothetical protein